jgi:hypothetical protein
LRAAGLPAALFGCANAAGAVAGGAYGTPGEPEPEPFLAAGFPADARHGSTNGGAPGSGTPGTATPGRMAPGTALAPGNENRVLVWT